MTINLGPLLYHLAVNGVDIGEHVNGVEIDQGAAACTCPGCSGADTCPCAWRWCPCGPAPDTHTFAQDPAEEATLCDQCGMWPEHHSHGAGRCVCRECMPDASDLPEDYDWEDADYPRESAAWQPGEFIIPAAAVADFRRQYLDAITQAMATLGDTIASGAIPSMGGFAWMLSDGRDTNLRERRTVRVATRKYRARKGRRR